MWRVSEKGLFVTSDADQNLLPFQGSHTKLCAMRLRVPCHVPSASSFSATKVEVCQSQRESVQASSSSYSDGRNRHSSMYSSIYVLLLICGRRSRRRITAQRVRVASSPITVLQGTGGTAYHCADQVQLRLGPNKVGRTRESTGRCQITHRYLPLPAACVSNILFSIILSSS